MVAGYPFHISTYLFHSIFNHPLSNRGLPLAEGESLEAFVHA